MPCCLQLLWKSDKKTGSHVNIRVRNISVQDEADFLFAIYKSISACPKNDNRARCEKRFIRHRLSFLTPSAL
ncbi:hypothetical protein DWX17_08480 [[Clostridium] innocuum]|nr:hypothetical protein DWX17_08480 [[Clostridium] innocuum]